MHVVYRFSENFVIMKFYDEHKNVVSIKRRVFLLSQSFPSLRFARVLRESNHSVVIISSNPAVAYSARNEGFYVIELKCVNDLSIFNIIPNVVRRNFLSLYESHIAFKVLERMKKYQNLDFIITIIGMDWKILPAFLNLDKCFYFWDDSMYARRHSSQNIELFQVIKCFIQNKIYKCNYTLHSDSIMINFPWTKDKDLPLTCQKIYLQQSRQENSISGVKRGIVLLGDYDFYELSRKCNIIKLIKLIELLKQEFPDQVYYKPHPGTQSTSHSLYFHPNEILHCDVPVESLAGEYAAFLTLGSAAVLELDRNGANTFGIGEIVGMCADLFPMSERQGLKHSHDIHALLSDLRSITHGA